MREWYPGGPLRSVGITPAEFAVGTFRFGYDYRRVHDRALGRTRSPADETASGTLGEQPTVGAYPAPPERRTAEDEVDAATRTSGIFRRRRVRQGTPVRRGASDAPLTSVSPPFG